MLLFSLDYVLFCCRELWAGALGQLGPMCYVLRATCTYLKPLVGTVLPQLQPAYLIRRPFSLSLSPQLLPPPPPPPQPQLALSSTCSSSDDDADASLEASTTLTHTSPSPPRMSSFSGVFQIDMSSSSSFALPLPVVMVSRLPMLPCPFSMSSLFVYTTFFSRHPHPRSRSQPLLCAYRPSTTTSKPTGPFSVSDTAVLQPYRPPRPARPPTPKHPLPCPSQTPAHADGSPHMLSPLHPSPPRTRTALKRRRASSPTTATSSPSRRPPARTMSRRATASSSLRQIPPQRATTTTRNPPSS